MRALRCDAASSCAIRTASSVRAASRETPSASLPATPAQQSPRDRWCSAIAAIGIHSSLVKGHMPLTLEAVTPTMVTGCRFT